MSFGAFDPRSVSEGWMDSNTPAISPLSGSTLATEKTAWPLNAIVLLVFSFASSSESDRAGKATALSYPVEPPRPCKCQFLAHYEVVSKHFLCGCRQSGYVV